MDALERRVRQLNDRVPRTGAAYVLYWVQANRRADSNHALEWAVRLANEFGLPLLVYEGLTCSYPNANRRLHTFVLEGVPELGADLRRTGAGYFFYLRRNARDPNDVLYRLAARAAFLVTDDFPSFNVADHNRRVPQRLDIPYYVVDSSCIVPMNVHEKRAWAAYTIRPKIHRELPNWLSGGAHLLPLQQLWAGGACVPSIG